MDRIEGTNGDRERRFGAIDNRVIDRREIECCEQVGQLLPLRRRRHVVKVPEEPLAIDGSERFDIDEF